MGLPSWIVHKRKYLFWGTCTAALLCLYLMLKVTINTDMSQYLSSDSPMKQGVAILSEEWSDLPIDLQSSISAELPMWIVVAAVEIGRAHV